MGAGLVRGLGRPRPPTASRWPQTLSCVSPMIPGRRSLRTHSNRDVAPSSVRQSRLPLCLPIDAVPAEAIRAGARPVCGRSGGLHDAVGSSGRHRSRDGRVRVLEILDDQGTADGCIDWQSRCLHRPCRNHEYARSREEDAERAPLCFGQSRERSHLPTGRGDR